MTVIRSSAYSTSIPNRRRAPRQHDHFAVIRRVLAVMAMLAGAVIAALLVLEVSDIAAVGFAACLLTIVAGSAIASSRSPASWHAPRP